MTPQISNNDINEFAEYTQPDLTYKSTAKKIFGKINGIESIKQSINHILLTERYSNPIYDDDYGVELEQFIGKDIGFISANIEDVLKQALCQDDRIVDVVVDEIEEISGNSCIVNFTVFTKLGTIQRRINVLQ